MWGFPFLGLSLPLSGTRFGTVFRRNVGVGCRKDRHASARSPAVALRTGGSPSLLIYVLCITLRYLKTGVKTGGIEDQIPAELSLTSQQTEAHLDRRAVEFSR